MGPPKARELPARVSRCGNQLSAIRAWLVGAPPLCAISGVPDGPKSREKRPALWESAECYTRLVGGARPSVQSPVSQMGQKAERNVPRCGNQLSDIRAWSPLCAISVVPDGLKSRKKRPALRESAERYTRLVGGSHPSVQSPVSQMG
ncbi:hypothetical protein NDU88_004027 [Pleurodeles waltl]|uniref:Uncharacterized protein n=1 Tax=Pleurodeles waltl TaxID=8319 RepID=A0AAV7VIM2_PLEWA|nr:hypothetical protein NDU88_004027 [Pleurodeles waltl]